MKYIANANRKEIRGGGSEGNEGAKSVMGWCGVLKTYFTCNVRIQNFHILKPLII